MGITEAIATKIQKLLKLANGTTFVDEASTALGKAQALMTEHNITQAMLNDLNDGDDEIKVFSSRLNEEDTGKKQLATWKWTLAYSLSSANGVYTYCRGSAITLVGRPSNVDAVRYLYQYCLLQIDALTTKHCRGEGRTYANNFRFGCVDAIRSAIERERAELLDRLRKAAAANNDCRALTVINNTPQRLAEEIIAAQAHLSQKGTKIRTIEVKGGRLDDSARTAGQHHGKGIYPGKTNNPGLKAPNQRLE